MLRHNCSHMKPRLSLRSFYTASVRAFPRRLPKIAVEKTEPLMPAPPSLKKSGLLLDDDEGREEDYDDGPDINEGTSAGHHYLDQQRQVLQYMRLIEHDLPNLVRWRVPFTPPAVDRPLAVRVIDYGGEEHPATAKRAVVVPVARLPFSNPNAIHTFKLLAGTRWTHVPPADSGIGPNEGDAEHGYIKISCEDYPQPGMNLKWISDVLDKLIAEAHGAGDTFVEIPQDARHIFAKNRRKKKGSHPSLKDFPQTWLPRTTDGAPPDLAS